MKCSNGRFNVLAVHFQPQTFALPRQPRQDDLQHRPDAPGARRTSPPEVVTKVLQALEEMGEPVGPSTVEKMRGASSKSLGYLLHSGTSSTRMS
ncbi:hypothetical protein ALC57_03708 [Trachymyrmex cornetzi]|uniref:Uncharacterized protein n=1 Tax=Trachymyrmex cornetzi TaxID=471704 RepID=A0A151JLZ2_9HYME|nr:hypothetical protein ALC57_03708 [Trachymyrmex cornetzi]